MELSEIVKSAFEMAFPGEDFSFVRVLPATDPRFGDYQCNDALKVAKKLHANPREIGAKVEVAGPGFLNLTVAPGWLNARLAALDA